MTLTLCIETSGPHCSLALETNGHVYARDELLERSHNEHLLAMLDELYQEAGVKPVETELVGFGCGPGSFTGVRIAASACQAIAMRADARVVPVSSSAALAATALNAHEEAPAVVVAIRSRGDAYYLSRYVRDAHGGVLQTHEDELVTAAPGWLASGELIAGTVPDWLGVDSPAAGLKPGARDMLPLAQATHRSGRSVAPEQALPRYFAGDSPWRKQGAG